MAYGGNFFSFSDPLTNILQPLSLQLLEAVKCKWDIGMIENWTSI